MSSCRTGIVRSELRAWDTDEVRRTVANGSCGLTNAVAVRAVIAGNRAVLKACAGVASTTDVAGSPSIAAGREVRLTKTRYTAWRNALIRAVTLSYLMCTGWAGIVRSELVAWDTDEVRGSITDGSRCLTNAVAVRAVVTSNRTVFETCTRVASSADAV